MSNRKVVLLTATRDILRKCDSGPFVEDVMSTTAVWDGVDCDGNCLLDEIEHELEFPDSVEISLGEYRRLQEDSEFLACLEAAGVDNWDGYSEAYGMMNNEDDL